MTSRVETREQGERVGLRELVLRPGPVQRGYLRARQAVELAPRRLRARGGASRLSAEERAAYEALVRDGIHVLPGFLEPEVVTAMRSAVDRAIDDGRYSWSGHLADEEPPPAPPGRMNVIDATLCDPQFVRSAVDERLTRVADAVLGVEAFISGIVAYRTQPTADAPQGAFLWHHDQTRLQVKAICYLTDVDEDTGPLQYVRGSHHRRSVSASYEETRIPEDEVPTAGRLTCVAPAGTVILVDTNGIHRGTPNRSGARDVVTFLYDAGVAARRDAFYNLPVPTPVLRTLPVEARRRLRVPVFGA